MNIVLIAAAGHGSRTGNKVPKQFTLIKGKPLVLYTVEKFFLPNVDAIVVAVSQDMMEYCRQIVKDFFPKKNIFVTLGGESRNQTLSNAISSSVKEFGLSDDDIILTHDSARPYVDSQTVHRCIAALETYDVCTAAVRATDTIVASTDGNEMMQVYIRQETFHCQTPQCFRLGAYRKMIERTAPEAMSVSTDICTLFLGCGYKVKLVEGNAENIKITYQSDLDAAEFKL